MTNPTNPHGAAGGVTGSAGSAVDDTLRSADPKSSSPWARDAARSAESPAPTANETTTSLPVVSDTEPPYPGKAEPYPGKVAAAATTGPVTTAPPPPMSAVDQYAALTGSGAPASTAGPAMVARPVAAPVPPGLPRPGAPIPAGAGLAGAVPPGPVPANAATVKAAKAIRRPKAARSPRRAKLQLRHLNVWSVLRFSCVLAIALFFVWLIMVGVLYGVLDVTHVFSKVNDTVRTINGDTTTKDVITPGVVFGGAFIIGLVNIVLFIALSTIGSVVYNLCADLVGGIEVTLAEHE